MDERRKLFEQPGVLFQEPLTTTRNPALQFRNRRLKRRIDPRRYQIL